MKKVLLTLLFAWPAMTMTAQPVQGGLFADTLGIKVYQLWGTHAQRGYAQGYLTGDRITDLIKNYVKPSFGAYYTTARSVVSSGADIVIPAEYAQEAQSVIDGMNAAGMNPQNYDAVDIEVANSMLDVGNVLDKKLMMGNGCSTLMSWGDATLGTDLDGKAICSRHMDWTISPVLYNNNTVIVHFPTEADERPWLLIGYAGMMSALSGVNQDFAVFQQMMSDMTIQGLHNKQYEPIWMTLRKALEKTDYNNDGQSNVQDVRSALADRTTGFADAFIITAMGTNHPVDSLVAMVAEITPTAPTHTYRYNDFPDSIPGDNLYAANYRIKRNNAMNFCSRYNAIRSHIGDGTLIGTALNWELMRDYSHQSTNMQFMQYGPESDLLRLSVYGNGKPAFLNDSVDFHLSQIYANVLNGAKESRPPDLTVFPNPCRDRLDIRQVPAGDYHVTILDAGGKVVYASIRYLPGTIGRFTLDNGIYFLRIVSDSFQSVCKMRVTR